MSCQVQDKLYLVMEILTKFAVDTICNNLVIFKVWLEKTFEFRPSDRNFF